MSGTSVSMYDQYFQIFQEKQKEYGEKTTVLMECGSFFEIYELDNATEKIGNAKILSKLLNDMEYANKKGDTDINSRTFPNFIGFNVASLWKFLPILLKNGYTVIEVRQLETADNKVGKIIKRGVTKIHSPSLYSPDYCFDNDSSNLLHILCDTNSSTSIFSICSVNNVTNDIELTEVVYSDLERVLYRYLPSEIQIKIKQSNNTNEIVQFFKEFYGDGCTMKIVIIDSDNDNNNSEIYIYNQYKNYKKSDIQNEYFTEVYKHLDMGMMTPIEFLNLEKYPVSIINLMYTIDFMGRHDLSYIKNLNKPTIIHDSSNLILELNTINQLNIFGKNGVFDIINNTQTAIGRRHLKSVLTKPFKNVEDIQFRYTLTEYFSNLPNETQIIQQNLESIIDFERLHRKMGLELLHPYEFVKLDNAYIKILNIMNLNIPETIRLNTYLLQQFNDYISDYRKKFNLNIMKKFSLNTNKDEIINYFNTGIISDLDVIQNKINQLEIEREELRLFYDNLINTKMTTGDKETTDFIKLSYTENEGYSFECTKIRYQSLLTKLKKSEIPSKVKNSTNKTKFFPEKLEKLSNEILANRKILNDKIKLHYIQTMNSYYKMFNNLFNQLKMFTELVDITMSNLKTSRMYRYTKPIINNLSNSASSNSYLDAKQIRHPIIERLNTNYIPNDILLNDTTNGMLLYGLNSSGKSSLLRAIGISIILAQSGLYVPCNSFTFSPFHNLISQVDLSDDLFKGKSSFITEMIGLKKIISCAGPNTLVLSDELCKGTEVNSAVGIVGASILSLINKNTKFFFTTHLHQLVDIHEVNDNSKLNICHLSVITKNNNIIFERKLQKGSGSDLYGLEVAKSILKDSTFIDSAFNIRNTLTKQKTKVLELKKSKYNSKKIMNKCEICGSSKNLESDHINEQHTADSDGFINHFHKNEKFNLASLCKECHLKKTLGKIVINGYKDSINGKFLDYSCV
jgi:DNA mismatch repair protein MutS